MKTFAIVGSRHFTDYELFCEVCDTFKCQMQRIVSGGARGADTLAERYAKENRIELLVFPAEWHLYGKAAGPKRNQQIVDEADHMIAFLAPHSKGTRNSITLAQRKGIPTDVVEVEK